eukprot:1239897-Prymnesium_polylepis.1
MVEHECFEQRSVGKGKKKTTKEFVSYKILWENFPPECATWESEDRVHDDFIDEYEAALEAEAELEAEEARALEEEDDDMESD